MLFYRAGHLSVNGQSQFVEDYDAMTRRINKERAGDSVFRRPLLVLRAVSIPSSHDWAAEAVEMQENRTSLRPVCEPRPQFLVVASLTNLAETPPRWTAALATSGAWANSRMMHKLIRT